MKKLRFFALSSTLLLIFACTKKDNLVNTTKDGPAVIADGIIAGELSFNPVASLATGQVKPIKLSFKKASGENYAEMTTTLQIKSSRTAAFTANIPQWFDRNTDWVAGTVDLGESQLSFSFTETENGLLTTQMNRVEGTRVMNGAISLEDLKTRVYINDADFSYDWSKISNEQLKLVFRNINPAANEAEYGFTSLNLNVKKGGLVSFTFNLPPWFNTSEDLVAGAIDVDPSSGSASNPTQLKILGPTNKISFISNDPVDYILPMYFPFMKTDAAGNVFPVFKSFGSMLYFKMTNNLNSPYVVYSVSLSSDALDFAGVMDFRGKAEGEEPAWIGAANATSWLQTNKISAGTSIPSLTMMPGRYVWAKQDAEGTLAPFTIKLNEPPVNTNGNNYITNVNPYTIVRPAAAALLQNNRFYGFTVNINPELLFTEFYVNGQSNNIWIEIYNNSTNTVTLTNYYLIRVSSTGQVLNYYQLTTPSIAPGKTVCVGYSAATLTTNMISTNAVYERSADPTLLLKDYKGAGDQVLYLAKSAPLLENAIDVYKPATNSEHLTRYSYIKLPQTNWTPAQWFNSSFQFETLGAHTVTAQ